MSALRGPLAGVRVIELAHIAAGPFAGMLLADMGADVVKLEPPAGDAMRGWPPHVETDDGTEFSLNFASLNRNKRSISLDLKHPDDLDIARSLISQADVVLENFRPGALARLGLGFEDVRAFNPEIVFCSISGYGQEGPSSMRGAFDVVIQAEGGLMDVTGFPHAEAAKCGVPVADFVAGQYAAFAVVCALRTENGHRDAVHIDCSMLESVLAIAALQTSQYWGTGAPPHRLGTAHPRNAPYQGFRGSDREFVLAAGNDRLWQRVCEEISRTDLVADPRFATQAARVEHVDELAAILQSAFSTAPAASWVQRFGERGVPCALVADYAEALANPQLATREFVRDLAIPGAPATSTTVMPLHFGGTNSFQLAPPPELGEHRDLVIEDWLGGPHGKDASRVGADRTRRTTV